MIYNYRQKIVDEAKSWVSTPYKHHFMNKGIGVSCGLFIIGIFSNLGFINKGMPPFFNEDWAFHNPDKRMPTWFDDILSESFKEIESKDLDKGDLILYNFGKDYALSHISILIEDDMIIHSEKPIGVTISNRKINKWYKRERIYFTYGR